MTAAQTVAQFDDGWQSRHRDLSDALPTDDALMTMPPEPAEFEDPDAIGRFLSTVPAAGAVKSLRLVPTRANGQPAFGCYLRDPRSPIAHAYGLMVLTLHGDRAAGRDSRHHQPRRARSQPG